MTMNTKLPLLIIMGAAGLLLLVVPGSATLSQIPAGGTVFLGESNLDISAAAGAGDANISWWASGADINAASPDYTYYVQNTNSFTVSPSAFGSHLGAYYLTTTKTPVFTVVDPQLAIRVEDTSVGNVDVTNMWVPTDDALRFRIESNLMPMLQRGVASVPVTIRVQDPNGAIYTSLLDGAGAATPIDPIGVTSNPFYTGSIWNTSQRSTYPPGLYTIWAECNVNSMKDNYQVTGKTVSQTISLRNQDQNPRISNPAYGTNPTTAATTSPTVAPATSRPVTTTVSPTPAATKTPVPTTVVTTPAPEATTIPVTSLMTETPVTSPTKSPGFGIVAGIASLAAGFVVYALKK